MLDISKIVSESDLSEEQVIKLKNSKLPTVLFGFGGMVYRIYQSLHDMGLPILYICDNNPAKQGISFMEAKVISFSQLKQIYKDCNILINVRTHKFAEQIKNQILSDGQFQHIYNFELYYPLGNLVKKSLADNADSISSVYNMLADEKSRNSYIDKLNYLVTKDAKYANKVVESEEYFPADIFDISDHECFVDMGAYDGADSIRLKNKFGGIQKAWCFEPDPNNFMILQENTTAHADIICEQAAVWSKTKKLSFAASGTMGSGVYENGATKVNGIAIDDYFKNQKITFLKMDVEGAEIEGLKGAAHTIATQMPKLAICIYHLVDHHWEVPLLIKQICPQYKLYLRNLDETGIETVCFAKK